MSDGYVDSAGSPRSPTPRSIRREVCTQGERGCPRPDRAADHTRGRPGRQGHLHGPGGRGEPVGQRRELGRPGDRSRHGPEQLHLRADRLRALGADGVVAHATGEGTIAGAFTTTYDKAGQLVELQEHLPGRARRPARQRRVPISGSTGEGESQSVATSTTIAVDDTNRALVDDWLSFRSGAGSTLSLLQRDGPGQAATRPTPSSSCSYQHAKTSQVTYLTTSRGQLGVRARGSRRGGVRVRRERGEGGDRHGDRRGLPPRRSAGRRGAPDDRRFRVRLSTR